MDNPVYVGVRRRIAESRTALTDADLPDQVEISARLDGIQGQIESLQFEAAGDSTEPNVAADAVDANPGWWARLKASLAGLVTVRRAAEGEQSRRTLEDKDLLRQGLWMQVEGARLALMRHDQSAWEDALSRASSALERWFLESAADYQAVSQGFDDLAAIDIDPELPDISGPWSQFELIRNAGSTALPPPAPVDPVPGEATSSEENDDENDSPAASDEAAEEAQSDGQA
jgi:uroporphyrin-3 C-methyltransferase